MEALQAIKERKSYRSTFKQEPIPREDLKELVEAGFLAPSGCNMQTTKFIAVDDPELVKKLADIYGHEWAATAPAAILLLTKHTVAPSGESYHIQDFAAAAENILIAAAAKGYATTWIEGQLHHNGEDRKMAELLGVPEDLNVAVYMPIGIPASTVPAAKKKTFEERAWFNRYGEN
ncbi:nitroreductase family protein [Clostridium transplantifaecale]|uniref:nitroreductase family protein n=1 Tax=Clostridium transplantifaecale TaxID=2479838 RepID=UPI000F6319DF|nr:nitroreductase family protein [Clostridium transplantifaecale]